MKLHSVQNTCTRLYIDFSFSPLLILFLLLLSRAEVCQNNARFCLKTGCLRDQFGERAFSPPYLWFMCSQVFLGYFSLPQAVQLLLTQKQKWLWSLSWRIALFPC